MQKTLFLKRWKTIHILENKPNISFNVTKINGSNDFNNIWFIICVPVLLQLKSVKILKHGFRFQT